MRVLPCGVLLPLFSTMFSCTPGVGALDVGAAGRDLHLLEHVEVVVGRRRAERGHVGDRDAVHVPRVVAAARALGLVVRLLARLGAADVDAVDDDAGNGLQDDPRVARRMECSAAPRR